MNAKEVDIEHFIRDLLKSRKYRELELPEVTIRDLLQQEISKYRTSREAFKVVRQKLHNIVASYLGDADYQTASEDLSAAFACGDSQKVRAVCEALLRSHASTRERLKNLSDFYKQLFAVTGQPDSILDLACGMNPFAFSWMALPTTIRYYAYDIHRPRVALINQYFILQGLQPLAEVRDVLVAPPDVEAEVAFFFKEAHRFEQRRRGCNRDFWRALRVKWLLVSLPAKDLTGHHSMIERQRALIKRNLAGLSWPVTEVMFDSEIVFCIQKS
jgi:16S rRNA (guanine(1405)-N(7))-methyltransferase